MRCPDCRRADASVGLAMDARRPCPHCGAILHEFTRLCCIPRCGGQVLVTAKIPVCDPCGIKIAMVFGEEAAKYMPAVQDRRREQEADAERRNEESFVYYVWLDEKRIKIGFTSNLQARMSALRVHPSALLAIEPGGRDLEKLRHREFATERLNPRMEDFEPSPRLRAWIAVVTETYDLPQWAKVPDTRVIRRTA